MKKFLVINFLVLFSLSASAHATGGWQGWYRGHAPQLVFATPTHIEVVFRSVDVPPAPGREEVVCPDNRHVRFDVLNNTPDYKQLLAMLLLAKTNGDTIGFAGNGVCDIGNGAMGTGGTEVFIDD